MNEHELKKNALIFACEDVLSDEGYTLAWDCIDTISDKLWEDHESRLRPEDIMWAELFLSNKPDESRFPKPDAAEKQLEAKGILGNDPELRELVQTAFALQEAEYAFMCDLVAYEYNQFVATEEIAVGELPKEAVDALAKVYLERKTVESKQEADEHVKVFASNIQDVLALELGVEVFRPDHPDDRYQKLNDTLLSVRKTKKTPTDIFVEALLEETKQSGVNVSAIIEAESPLKDISELSQEDQQTLKTAKMRLRLNLPLAEKINDVSSAIEAEDDYISAVFNKRCEISNSPPDAHTKRDIREKRNALKKTYIQASSRISGEQLAEQEVQALDEILQRVEKEALGNVAGRA